MKFIKDNWLIIVVVFLFGGNLLQYLNPVIKVKEVVKTDTITSVITDSVSLIRAKAELNYLREELRLANGKIVYVQKTDTIQIIEQNKPKTYVIPEFVASLDTTFSKGDELSIKYLYPQNYFNLDFKYKSKAITIKETKEVQVKPLFDFSHGFIAGAFVTPSGTVQVGIGYGLQLKLNF